MKVTPNLPCLLHAVVNRILKNHIWETLLSPQKQTQHPDLPGEEINVTVHNQYNQCPQYRKIHLPGSNTYLLVEFNILKSNSIFFNKIIKSKNLGKCVLNLYFVFHS